MKKSSFVPVIIALVLGYVLGSIFPLNLFGSDQVRHPFDLSVMEDRGIEGDARLEVVLVMDNGRLLDNVEVDLAEAPGQPPIGGVALSDENGVAVFDVKPGNYFIFFNDVNFPQNVQTVEPIPVEVKEGEVNRIEVTLTIR